MSASHHEARVRPAGENWVWLTSMGLASGLLMVAALLLLIFTQGLATFWPKPLSLIQLRAGSDAGLHRAPQLAGAIVETRQQATAGYGADDGARAQEYHLFVGNREVYELSFLYLPKGEVTGITTPPDLLIGERREGGSAVFFAVRLTRADGTVTESAAPGFIPALRARVAELGLEWRAIRAFEREQIGPLNNQLRQARLRAQALRKRGGDAAELAALEGRAKELQKRIEELNGEVRARRERLEADRLTYRLATGEEVTVPASRLLRVYAPNAMDFGAQLGFFFEHLWEFLSEEPREANTEGGIFPAIFGTFVMTVLMSAAVMPFGVVAAIYLREYAKQGTLVQIVRIAVNNLAGVPSIVFGVFGLGFFVYTIGAWVDDTLLGGPPDPVFGTGGVLWASLTLALLTVPVVIVATEEALAAVPRGVREASLALGASKWQTIQRVVMPAAAPGMLTGLILAMARGAGEVAPLMLVGVVKYAPELPIDGAAPFVHLERKFMHLGFHIYDLGFQSPDSDAARPMVFATTLLLISLVLLLNLGAILIRNHLRRKYAAGTF